MERWTAAFIFVAWVAVHIEPKFTNKFHYYQNDDVQDSDLSSFKALNYIKNFSLLISWFVSSNYKKASMADVDLDPEGDDNDGQDSQSDAEADDRDTTADIE